MDELDRILALARSERPNLRLVAKADSALMRAVGVALRPLVPDFSTRFTTVLGDVVYLPRPPDEMDRRHLARILAHELVHQIDMAAYGPLFYATYAVAMPTGRTLRAHWERRAYAIDLSLAHLEGGEPALRRALDWIVPLFHGPAYGFMWAGEAAARAYVGETADRVRAGTIQTEEPWRRILEAWTGPSGIAV